MAYYDENGRITIDEVAAQKDVNNLRQLNEILAGIIDTIGQIELMASEFDSETNKGILEEVMAIKLSLKNLSEQTTITSDFIKNVVRKYQAIDKKLKDAFNSTNGAGGN